MYTITDLQAMSNLELRKVIAEMKGYGGYEAVIGYVFTKDGRVVIPPHYPESISDAYALEEEVIQSGHLVDYVNYLSSVLNLDYESIGEYGMWRFIHATPREKCEAYYLTMRGEWEG